MRGYKQTERLLNFTVLIFSLIACAVLAVYILFFMVSYQLSFTEAIRQEQIFVVQTVLGILSIFACGYCGKRYLKMKYERVSKASSSIIVEVDSEGNIR